MDLNWLGAALGRAWRRLTRWHTDGTLGHAAYRADYRGKRRPRKIGA